LTASSYLSARTPAPEEIARAAAALARGEVVAYPTETFYGLGADALAPGALDRLLDVKGNRAEKAISVLIAGPEMLEALVADVSPLARRLMAAHWPGALTLVLPARPALPEVLVSDGFIAVRESPHSVARGLVAALGRPVTATSANRSGEPPPTTAEAARAALRGACDVLDGGATPGGAPSTLVRVRGDKLEILRQGAVRVF
jgi:L-threonylcarbamoyladenylate synthase